MKQLLLALWIAFFGVATITSETVLAQATAPNVTGDWVVQISGDELFSGTLHFTQVGTTVIGSAEAGKALNGGGVMQVSGTLSGHQLTGNWRAPKGETGWVTLNFQPEFHAFSGEWGYGGRKANGKIVSKKFTATKF
jgi:hypothetical protein